MKLIVWASPSIVNVLVTLSAAEYSEFPPCDAVMEQVPGPAGRTEEPEMVQTDGELIVKVTVKPDDAENVSDWLASVVLILFG